MSGNKVVIAVTNSKGGVGKTTSTLNLGAALAEEGKRVLLIDNDVQGNLTASMGFTPGEQKYTLANLLLAAIDYPEDLELHIHRSIIHTASGPDLIPANKRLADAAARLQVMQLSQYNGMDDSQRKCESIIGNVLSLLRQNYDYIIIDCGMKYELLTVNALAAADYCIVPIQSHYLASEGIPDVLELVRTVQAKFNPRFQIAGILLTMFQTQPRLCREIKDSVHDVYGSSIRIFSRPIEYSIRVAECPAVGVSILEYEPKNAAAEAYRCLAQEVLRLE